MKRCICHHWIPPTECNIISYLSYSQRESPIEVGFLYGPPYKSPVLYGETAPWTYLTETDLSPLGRRGREGPPRPRRTPQIATEPPNIPHRPLRPGETVDGGDEGSHGTCVAWADLSGEPAAEGAPQGTAGPRRPGEAGSVQPAEDERGRHTA